MLTEINYDALQLSFYSLKKGWKNFKSATRPTSPNMSNAMLNLIINMINMVKIQNIHLSCSMRHLPWRADECIFSALPKARKQFIFALRVQPRLQKNGIMNYQINYNKLQWIMFLATNDTPCTKTKKCSESAPKIYGQSGNLKHSTFFSWPN